MGNWVQLRSGGGYDFESKSLFGPYTMENDLAATLAGIHRAVGHMTFPWTVALHSVAVGRLMLRQEADKAAAAAGLLHDAHEGVIGDIPTPVAWELGYDKVKALKESVQEAIETRLVIPRLSCPDAWEVAVKKADAAALHVERQLFMAPGSRPWGYKEPDPEWCQDMYNIIREMVSCKEHEDGGKASFITCFEAWL